jgi:hypothetical protein
MPTRAQYCKMRSQELAMPAGVPPDVLQRPFDRTPFFPEREMTMMVTFGVWRRCSVLLLLLLLVVVAVPAAQAAATVHDPQQQQEKELPLQCSLSGDEGVDPALHEMTYNVGEGDQTVMVYVEPAVHTMYPPNIAPPSKTRVVPKFNGLAGKFINLSNQAVTLYWYVCWNERTNERTTVRAGWGRPQPPQCLQLRLALIFSFSRAELIEKSFFFFHCFVNIVQGGARRWSQTRDAQPQCLQCFG